MLHRLRIFQLSLITGRRTALFQALGILAVLGNHRCLIPADAFYKWMKVDKVKIPTIPASNQRTQWVSRVSITIGNHLNVRKSLLQQSLLPMQMNS